MEFSVLCHSEANGIIRKLEWARRLGYPGVRGRIGLILIWIIKK
jgi:hypothetical protein